MGNQLTVGWIYSSLYTWNILQKVCSVTSLGLMQLSVVSLIIASAVLRYFLLCRTELSPGFENGRRFILKIVRSMSFASWRMKSLTASLICHLKSVTEFAEVRYSISLVLGPCVEGDLRCKPTAGVGAVDSCLYMMFQYFIPGTRQTDNTISLHYRLPVLDPGGA